MQPSLREYLVASIDELTRIYNHPGFLVTGDFNSLETDFFSRQLNFKQKVKVSTRGGRTLDKIFTNMHDSYNDASVLPPLGKSDHNCVVLQPTNTANEPVGDRTVCHRIFSKGAYDNIARELLAFNWSTMYLINDCQEQANILYTVLNDAIEKFAPITKVIYKNNDKPWINAYFKNLIQARNIAYLAENEKDYKQLRNKVNRVRKQLQHKYFNNKIKHLKMSNNAKWWKEVKGLCGLKQTNRCAFSEVSCGDRLLCEAELPDAFNELMISLAEGRPPLSDEVLATLRSKLGDCPD